MRDVDPNRSDRDLVGRMLRGDATAFDRFVDEYYPRLVRFAYVRVGRDPEATDEVVQGTFEKVMPKLGLYRGEAALFSWLCSFCRYEIAAFFRARGRRAPEISLAEDAPAVRATLESLAVLDDDPERLAERRDVARLVRVALDHLPIHYGNALEWKYIQGLSVREIGDRLELSPKAAESLLTRARQAFRDGFAAVAGG